MGKPEFKETDDVTMTLPLLDGFKDVGIDEILCPLKGQSVWIAVCEKKCPCCLEAYSEETGETHYVCGFAYHQLMSDHLVDISQALRMINSNITRLEYVVAHQGD